MPMYDRSAVMLARNADESSVVLTATVKPPQLASRIQWSKTGEGFDISPKGASCTVTGTDSFEDYDSHGSVTAKVDAYDGYPQASDTCDISVVKDKGNLIDNEDFSTSTNNGITVQRVIANKYSVSGTVGSGQVVVNLAEVPLQEGVYSLGKSDYSHVVTSGSGKLQVQVYVSDGGNLIGSANAALVAASYHVNVISTSANQGDTFSGYIVPFLTKVEDSGQLLGSYDLTQDVTGWSAGDDGSSVSFSGGEAVFSAGAYNSKLSLASEHFSHTPGTVYAAFVDIYSPTMRSIRMGDPGSPKTLNITDTKKRYGVLYTATTSQSISFMSDASGTIHLSNLKLVRVTDTGAFELANTLDEPRFESSSEFSFL